MYRRQDVEHKHYPGRIFGELTDLEGIEPVSWVLGVWLRRLPWQTLYYP